jgi:integrase
MRRLTVDDVDRWRDFLLSETTKRGALRAPRTVKDKYLSALRSTLNYAVTKRKLTENVALKVRVRVPRQARLRERDFTNAEAKAILSATLKSHEGVTAYLQRAYRWIPWLCAYTGARVNEMSQLRGEDVAEIEGVWTIRITPEAGSVKSGEARTVPVHPHLIEQGFITFVRKAGDGPLFYDPTRIRKPSATNRYVSKVGERLAAWVRDTGGVDDPNVPPNHGWRHLFKTRALDAGMPERIADAIQGHAPRSIGQTYGRVSLQAMNEALSNLPRFSAD